MQLSELLSELRENILHDRSNRTAGDSDLMWSDTTLVRYINEAQRRLARQGLVIRDGTTPEVTRVTLREGQEMYPLHGSIIAVISAKLSGDSADLTRSGHAGFDAYRSPSDGYFATAPLSDKSGKPLAYSTDEYISEAFEDSTMSAATMRVYPKPSAEYAGQVINLRVVRLPVNKLALNQCEIPEVPEDHHFEMLDWAAYLALRIVDADAGDPVRANEFRASFEAHAAAARRLVMRKMFAPQKWGFGRNGFSWET
jgi:hypothetical protein